MKKKILKKIEKSYTLEVVRWMKWVMIIFLPLEAYAVCVSAVKANLRAKPSSRGKITWVAPQFTPLVRMDRKGDWLKVLDQDGKMHWVYRASVTSKTKCSSVKYRFTNLRVGPGGRNALAKYSSAERYEAFRMIEKKKGWYHLKSTWGEKFWVSGKNMWLPIRKVRLQY